MGRDFHARLSAGLASRRHALRGSAQRRRGARGRGVSRSRRSAGTVVVRTHERRLYYVLGDGRAIRYPVGVGRAGKQWPARTRIDGKYVEAGLVAAAEVKRDKPSLPDVIPGGSAAQSDGRRRAHARGRRIRDPRHQRAGSVGGFVSYGCIRMFNQDVVDLYDRVSVGTTSCA
jgi:lipoprotein-anchoring transpeptidase ErfK/SrfK